MLLWDIEHLFYGLLYIQERPRISEEIADRTDARLKQGRKSEFLQVDRTRLSGPYKTWVFVRVSSVPDENWRVAAQSI